MRLFVVEVKDGGAKGDYETFDMFKERLQQDWVTLQKLQALDEALFAMVDIAHVGMVLPYRLGWVFLAEDVST